MKAPLFGLLSLFIVLGPLARAADDVVPSITPVSPDEYKKALKSVRKTWANFNVCDHAACNIYFDTFGVALSFNDGTIAPLVHERRHLASGHDCITNARQALEHGDKGLAVQWVMAGEIEDLQLRAWMGDHPDAVIEALQHCC
jgi:hypothetical protein